MNALLLPELTQQMQPIEDAPRFARIPLPINGDVPPEFFQQPSEASLKFQALERRRAEARQAIAGRLLHISGIDHGRPAIEEGIDCEGDEYTYVRLQDGRKLAYEDIGSRNDPPIVAFHGNPTSRKYMWPRPLYLHKTGMRLITFDRPGYGDSTRDRGHTIMDNAQDVRTLVDLLGLDRFAVVGRSGGAPAAMACAALMPDRVDSLSLLASVAPPIEMMADPSSDWSEGMSADNVAKYYDASRRTLKQVEEITMNHALEVQDDPNNFLKMLEPSLTDSDRAVLYYRGLKTLFWKSYSHALSQYGVGWADDMQAISAKDWGFKVGDIPPSISVHIWHGQADNHSPYAHARWLAGAIPHAYFESVPGASHFDAFVAFTDVILRQRDLLRNRHEA